ncbi:MAG TPA: hypothetical protein VJ608_15130, partial [Albitalea sp.]|nr:hypothetical protein [Albitalea sp.]
MHELYDPINPMSSTIMPVRGFARSESTPTSDAVTPVEAHDESEKNPFLVALGERVRSLRSRRGMTRKAVALAA